MNETWTVTFHFVGGSKKSYRLSKSDADFVATAMRDDKNVFVNVSETTSFTVNAENVTFVEYQR